MGSMTAMASLNKNGYAGIESLKLGGDVDLNDLYNALVSSEYTATSVFIEPHSDSVESIHIEGVSDLDRCKEWQAKRKSAKLLSFAVKSREGKAIKFSVDGESLNINRYRESTDQSNSELPDSQRFYLIGTALIYAIWSVDRYIDRNGLRPVIDEVKRRRWVIFVACSLITVYCQLGNC